MCQRLITVYFNIPYTLNHIPIGNDCINRVKTVKYLGLYINEKLDRKLHVDKLCNSLVKTAGMFKFIRNRIPNNCKHQMYYAYVYSKIVYGVEIYGNTSKYQINKLQVLQNKALKLLHKTVIQAPIHSTKNLMY